MTFFSAEFAVFLTAVLWFLVMLPPRTALGVLLAGSCLFYGWHEPKYIWLLVSTSLADFCLAHYFSQFADARRRSVGTGLSAVLNFGLLAYLKYTGFLPGSSIVSSGELVGSEPILGTALPLGISFYTFRRFAYVNEVLRNRLARCSSLAEFALYVSYFPQVVAGPIEPPHSLLPQLQKLASSRPDILVRLSRAILLFSEGWLRKAFADLLAAPVAAFYSGDPLHASGSQALSAVVGFALQIYGDFSGYSRMAQGVSHLLGVDLMDNFNLPYLATSMSEFWRCWHISLSTWIREYLHLPLSRRLLQLSGRRHRSGLQAASLVTTMSLVGLWHGASWNFALWGSLHGIFLMLEQWWERPGRLRLPRSLARLAVLLLVVAAWVPFRASSLATTLDCYRALANPGWSRPEGSWFCGCLGILACDALLYWSRKSRQEWQTWRWNLAVSSFAWLLVFCATWMLRGAGTAAVMRTEFIYSQF